MSSQPSNQPGFTPREQEVLVAICNGATYSAIARSLLISRHTVDTHIRRIKSKASVATRAELIVLAVRLGLFDVG